MSTKPPAGVAEGAPDSLEKIAYASVSEIPTTEPNDQVRLGYAVWAWLRERNGSLLKAVRAAGVRTSMPVETIQQIVTQRLAEKGISVQ